MSPLPKLLVIDDLAENIEVLAEFLSDTYEIECALSGSEGLDRIAQSAPDLILLDAMMPEMDGYAVCDALKRDPATRSIPVVFVTAKNDAESESRALAAGAVDFIHKPVNRDVVRARVRMHLELRARERELRALNADLERRVAERTQALREAMQSAEASHRAKQLFLANVNHELRTPMNAILGLSELLAKHAADPKQQRRVEMMRAACLQLLGTVDEIIDIADLQAGKVAIESVEIDLPSLLGDTLDKWRAEAANKNLSLTLEIDPALAPRRHGDPARLSQILGNFLSNAVRFSERGAIVLRARPILAKDGAAATRFEVEDRGIGIDAAHCARIFEAFERADNSYTRNRGGSGIGLAICKQLAALMGGLVGVESVPGQGSVFWAEIPERPG